MAQQTMKGYLFSKTSQPTWSYKEDLPVPTPRAGTVVVKVSALWIHPGVAQFASLPFPMPQRHFIPGVDGVGVIEGVGPDVFNLEKGQRVVISRHAITNENVPEPAQALVGVTSFHPGSGGMKVLEAFADGMLAEYCLAPKSTVTPISDNVKFDDVHLSLLPRFAIVYGGLVKGRLTAGETIIVTGATGQFGVAAVFVALAMGAGKVVAAGRNEKSLQSLVDMAADSRLTTVKLTGDVEVDATALRKATDGGAHMAFDMVGMAKDCNVQTSVLKSLLRGGRLVVMGSMLAEWKVPYFDLVLNDIEIIGKYMHDSTAIIGLLNLVKSGLLDLSKFKTHTFPLKDFHDAASAVQRSSIEESVFLVN